MEHTRWNITLSDTAEPTRRNVQREHVFQGVVNHFLERVVLPPCWMTAINHENELTDNARARARGRGVKPGVPDVYVSQAPSRSVWIELKWGDNKLSDAQAAVFDALWRCNIPHGVCWDVHGVLMTLHHAGIRLHGNASNLATEYQARAEAAVAKAEAKAAAPYKPGPARPKKPSAARVKAGNKFTRLRLGI